MNTATNTPTNQLVALLEACDADYSHGKPGWEDFARIYIDHTPEATAVGLRQPASELYDLRQMVATEMCSVAEAAADWAEIIALMDVDYEVTR